jgi:N utilization substance protein B
MSSEFKKDVEQQVDDQPEEEAGHETPLSYDDLSQRAVRSLIFHLLYAAEAHDYETSLDSIVENFNRGFDLEIPRHGKVFQVAQQVIDQRDALDEFYKPFLTNWRFDRIGVATKLILRFAVWELQATDTDTRIIINEAVELAKCFAEKDAFRFINGILDKAARELGREVPAELEIDTEDKEEASDE